MRSTPMTRLRLALPWAICLGLGTWLSVLPGRTPDLSGPGTKPATINKAVVSQKLATLQIPFIANQGQRDPQVKFYAPTLSGTTFVTQTGELVYTLPNQSRDKSQASLGQVKT